MKSNTFIIIVSAYTLLLGVVSLFFPNLALSYFAGEPENVQQQSLINFVGGYQLAMVIVGYSLWKTNEKASRKAWLLAVAFLCILAIALMLYNKIVRLIPLQETYLLDIAIWAIIASGSLYFRSKE